MRNSGVQILLSSILLVMLSMSLHAADPEALPFTLHEVGTGVWAAVAVPGGPAGSNAGFVIGDDGVAVIDTFQSARAAEQLLNEIRKRTDLPVRFVIDTHYHLDHVSGNGVFQAAGATIVAQRNVRAWERTENLKFFGNPVPADKRSWVESLILPNLVYDSDLDLFLGSRRLCVEVLPGHTGGDSVVVVPDADVVFTGDLFWNHALPNTIDADTGAWLISADRLLLAHPRATFVAGHGGVGHATDLRAFRGYLEDLRLAVAEGRGKGLVGDALVKSVREELSPKYAGWAFFEHFIGPNTGQMFAELEGTKRRPVPPRE